jgi:DDE superfamily endonuclease
VSAKGCAPIDRQMYLPKDWTNKSIRWEAAHVPDSICFVTKPEIAARMIERAVAAGVPFDWVAADTINGVEMPLRRAGKGYVLGAHATNQFYSWINKPDVAGAAEQITQGLAPGARRACQRVAAPRIRACMTAPISSWPISGRRNTTTISPACGHEGNRPGAPSLMGIWGFSRPRVRPGHRSRP